MILRAMQIHNIVPSAEVYTQVSCGTEGTCVKVASLHICSAAHSTGSMCSDAFLSCHISDIL